MENYNLLLKSLSDNAKTINKSGLCVEIRNCYDREEGMRDNRCIYASSVTRDDFKFNKDKLHPEFLANETHLLGTENYTSELDRLRQTFGWISTDKSIGIQTSYQEIPYKYGDVGFYKYELVSDNTDRPCMIFIHGGGFFAGSVQTIENQCKYLAYISNSVVIAVDYPLCPENRFPCAVNACYSVVNWVANNADKLKINPKKICVGGDSAGGNLALVCSIIDRDENKHNIAYQALIYPSLCKAESVQNPIFWSKDAYNNPYNDEIIEGNIKGVGQMTDLVKNWYLNEIDDIYNPYISPIYADAKNLPKTLIITAEYDFLTCSCEEYSRILNKANVKNRHICYGGIHHGVFDWFNYLPQSEDMILEIAKDIATIY